MPYFHRSNPEALLPVDRSDAEGREMLVMRDGLGTGYFMRLYEDGAEVFNIEIDGTVNMSGTLNVTGGVHYTGDLTVDGTTTTNGIGNTGTLANLGAFNETGTSSFNGNISQTSGSTTLLNTSVGTLDASGDITTSGNASVGGYISVTGDALINGNITMGGLEVLAWQTAVPLLSTDAGTKGDVALSSSFIYVCTTTGGAGAATWKRVAISTW